jgi:hypothetical protein
MPSVAASPEANPERLHVCSGCGSPSRAPLQGGQVACSRCSKPSTLPDRTALPTNGQALPSDDPERIEHLRAQDSRPRQVPATLQAVLGGISILPGREREALAIWQALRARSSQGDVAASEDLNVLTALMVSTREASPELSEALLESAFDAAVLPRHKQEHLGLLARSAVGRGDRAAAQRYLAWMIPDATELESDSQLRLSAAALATLDRDAERVLALLGPEKDEIPITDSQDSLATVLRANAHEMLGDTERAVQTLRDLPDPRHLEEVSARYSELRLCAKAGPAYAAAWTQESAKRAGASGVAMGMVLLFVVMSFIPFGIGAADLSRNPEKAHAEWFAGGLLIAIGGAFALALRSQARRAAWLLTHGLPLTARIVRADDTGVTSDDRRRYKFILQVAGPDGPYEASFEKMVHAHEVEPMIGTEVHVWADPNKLTEFVFADGTH